MNKQQPKGASADVGWGLILPGSSKQAKTWINIQCVRLHMQCTGSTIWTTANT